MNPNSEIYGAPETWQNAYNAGGINSAIGTALKCGRIKVPNFAAPNTGTYITSQIRTAVSNNKITANVPIDNSICAVGQGDKSPFKKIACHYYDEDNNTWYGPYITEITPPVNMFPYETYSANGLQGINGGFTNLNFAPLSSGDAQIWSENGVEIKYYNGRPLYYNANWRLAPFTYYQLKSIVLQILVNYTTNTSEPMTDAGLNEDHWITLDAWKNSYSQYPIVGCKVRMISAYQISGENIGYYYYVGENNSPYRSAFGLGLNHPIKHNDTDTFLSYTTFKTSQIDSDVIIFNKCYNLGGWGKYSKLCLPMWDKFSQYLQKPSNRAVLYRIPYSDTVYEELMQAVASLGFCFTPTGKTSFNVNFTDVDMCIPVIDDNGVTTGEYTRGSDNTNNDLYNADSVRDKGYNPINPPHNQYYDHTDLPTSGGTANNWYSDRTTIDGTVHMNLGNLFQAIADVADNPNNQQFLFQEPLKNILDYRRILLTQPWGDRPGTNEVIPLGAFTTAGTEFPFTGYKNFPRFRRVTLGSFSFDREFNNFLDFEPYTQAILYVPYCGVKQLPMNIFAGHTVNIYMNADNTSGVLQVLIFVDNIEWGTLSGMASEELPLIGETALTAANTKRELDYQQGQLEWSKMIGMGGSVAGASISAANKNPVGLIAQGASALFKNYYYNTQQAELQYQINHTKPEPLTIQKGDSSIDKMNVQYPFIMIQSPVIIGDDTFENIKQNYGHTKGFKCCETGVIGDFSGLTKCSAANLNGISCTYTEKKMIMEALQEGVIL